MTDATREAAINIWPVLVEVANRRTTIEYGELARRIGFGTAHLSHQLDVIWEWCDERKLPRLTMLVVDAKSGMPNCEPWSGGHVPAAEYAHDQKRVFDFAWAERTVEFVRYALPPELSA